MQTWPLNLANEEITALMRDFYVLTGLRIVIFDSHYNEVLAWPESHCPFCALMHAAKETKKRCLQSNEESFRRCKKSGKLAVYYCHAGLVEATAPLMENGTIVGYIMFGQITDRENKDDVREHIAAVLERYGIAAPEKDDPLYQITEKTREQIRAAAKILDACTLYVIQKELIQLQNQTFMQNLNQFLMEHLSEDLSIERLTDEFQISRSRLYELTAAYLDGGIAEHIRKLRIGEAKRLLKETDLKVMEISDRIGFADYNYFHRVFKAQTGVPAKKYRSLHQNSSRL